MRTITLGGHEYQINCSVSVDAEVTNRFLDFIGSAEEKANEDADAQDLNSAKRARLVDRRKKAAMKAYLNDAKNSLWQIAVMINDAVRYEAVMNNRDISKDAFGYPLTAEKLGMIATLGDLNSEETVKAVQDEFSACRGDAKNVTAGELKDAVKAIGLNL